VIRAAARVVDWHRRQRELRDAKCWEASGRPLPPPPPVKQEILRDYARRFELEVFVETGTYLGDTTSALKGDFSRIVSIELSDALYERARRRFAGTEHVTIMHGDSGKILPQVVAGLAEPALFWLDGHYSAGITARGEKETPVFEELEAVLDSPVAKSHVILIDDVRLFNGRDGWPSLDDLRAFVADRNSSVDFEERDDILRIHSAHT
jgi:hypothetical protein